MSKFGFSMYDLFIPLSIYASGCLYIHFYQEVANGDQRPDHHDNAETCKEFYPPSPHCVKTNIEMTDGQR